ncbi:hypothetical protein B0H14DRAFT_2597717 [Mycena olivaceomarginata]|nr:hypothetical protein B0H14DRAFT_2597717 [Mycena olivaceomarginata]
MGRTATLFPTVPTAPIPPAGAQDPLQLQLRAKPQSEPIVPVEPSEAPIRQLCKHTRTHNPSAPSLQPGKARKRAKKGGEKELNLDWGLVTGGKLHMLLNRNSTPMLESRLFSRVQLSKSERKIGVEDGYTVSTSFYTKLGDSLLADTEYTTGFYTFYKEIKEIDGMNRNSEG